MRHIQLDDDEKKAAKHDLLDQGAAAMLARITQLEKALSKMTLDRDSAYAQVVQKMDEADADRHASYEMLTADIARLHMVHYGMEHSVLHTMLQGLEVRIVYAGDTFLDLIDDDDARQFYDLCKALAYLPRPGLCAHLYEQGRMREHEIKMLDDIYR